MTKSIVFDTGPLISLTLNNLIWVIKPLNEKFGGEFYITPTIYNELIKRPLSTKKYKLEALQILPYIADGTIKMLDNIDIINNAKRLLDIANKCFFAHDRNINIVHMGEMEAVSCALLNGSGTIAIDERTTRVLIENPDYLKNHLERKLHTGISVNHDNLDKLKQELQNLKVIRSFELVTIAFELGLFDMYALSSEERLVPEIDNLKKAVLDGVLWGVKLNGCSCSKEEIYEVLNSNL